METTTFIMDDEGSKPRKVGGGIKNFTYTPTGTNGHSHRKNRERKKRQYLANQDARRVINQERGRLTPKEYHMRLDALSGIRRD